MIIILIWNLQEYDMHEPVNRFGKDIININSKIKEFYDEIKK